MTSTSAVVAVTAFGAGIGTLLDSAFGTSPAIETKACAVNAFTIVITITRACSNGTVSSDPTRWTQALSIETMATQRAIVGTEVVESDNRAVFATVARKARAGTIGARALATAIVRAHPRRGSAEWTSKALLARANSIETHAVVGAHVLAHSLVVIDTAVRARKSSRTTTSLIAEVTITIVTAVIGTNFNFTSNTAVTNTAIAATTNTDTVATAQLWTFSDTTIQSTVAWLTDTSAIVTIAVDALGTELSRAIWASPTLLAVANSIRAFTTQATMGWAMFVGTLFAKETWETVAGSVVAITIARTI